MKLIVMSDSHGCHNKIESIIKTHPNADAYLHCGDIEANHQLFPQLITIQGNNDFFYEYPQQQQLTFENKHIIMMHGHQFPYSNRLKHMANFAKNHNCQIFFYGHTHIAAHDVIDDIHLINPGSIYHSRDHKKPSYAIVTITENDLDVEFVFLND